MSKGSLFWGNASGKLGESVFYRAKGEQRNRTYVAHPSNPKTLAQMRNRITLNNFTSMYRALSAILGVSFTNKKSALSGFNAFVSANKSRLPYAITKDMLEGGMYVPVGVRVAQGDIALNVAPMQIPYVDPMEQSAPPRYSFQILKGQNAAVDTDNYDTFVAGLTGGDIYRIMTANGNPLALPLEFKVTLLWGSVDINAMTDGAAEGTMPLAFRSYLCSANSTDPGTYVGAAAYADSCKLLPIVTSADDNKESGVTSMIVDGIRVGSAMTADEGNSDVFGIIVSYTATDGLHCNNAYIYGGEGAIKAAEDYLPNGFVYEQVLEASGYSKDSVLSSSSAVAEVDLSAYTAALEESGDDEEEEV